MFIRFYDDGNDASERMCTLFIQIQWRCCKRLRSKPENENIKQKAKHMIRNSKQYSQLILSVIFIEESPCACVNVCIKIDDLTEIIIIIK